MGGLERQHLPMTCDQRSLTVEVNDTLTNIPNGEALHGYLLHHNFAYYLMDKFIELMHVLKIIAPN